MEYILLMLNFRFHIQGQSNNAKTAASRKRPVSLRVHVNSYMKQRPFISSLRLIHAEVMLTNHGIGNERFDVKWTEGAFHWCTVQQALPKVFIRQRSQACTLYRLIGQFHCWPRYYSQLLWWSHCKLYIDTAPCICPDHCMSLQILLNYMTEEMSLAVSRSEKPPDLHRNPERMWLW